MAAETQTTAKKKTPRSSRTAEATTGARKSTKKSVAKKTARTTAKKTRAAMTALAVEKIERMPTENVGAVEAKANEAYRPDPDEVAVAVLEAESSPDTVAGEETRREPEGVAPIVFDSVDDDIDRDESPAERQPNVTDADAVAPTATEILGDELRLVCFTLDNEEYGVDIQRVREINRVSRVTTMPDAPAYVKGIIDLRGHIIPIVDLRLRLGYPARDDDKHSRIVVLDFDGHFIGLIVDAVTEVLRVSRAHIDKTPDLAASTDRECLEGICQLDTRMILIIDYRKILQF